MGHFCSTQFFLVLVQVRFIVLFTYLIRNTYCVLRIFMMPFILLSFLHSVEYDLPKVVQIDTGRNGKFLSRCCVPVSLAQSLATTTPLLITTAAAADNNLQPLQSSS